MKKRILTGITTTGTPHIGNYIGAIKPALDLAKDITDKLSHDKQILLIDWMQQYYWEKEIRSITVKKLEELKIQLKSYINQKIAWEITLLEILKKYLKPTNNKNKLL